MPALNPLSVFVTGATSPVGRRVVRHLTAAGYRVAGAVSGSADGVRLRADGGTPAYPDVTRAGELRSALTAFGVSIIVHLDPLHQESLPFARPTWNNRALVESANAVVEAAKAAGVTHIVAASSVLAGMVADEEHAPPPELVARVAALNAAESAILNSGIAACILRLGAVYGTESDELVALRAALQTGRAVNVGELPAAAHGSHGDSHGHGAQLPFVEATDAARAILAAVQKAVSGVTLTIADGQPTAPAAFAAYFAAAQGLSLSASSSLLKRMMSPAAPAAARLHDAILALHLDADPAPARAALDWTPRFASYQQGIDDLLLSWRAGQR
jgi:nucleoside-diphosphate-sugar epimerase